MKQKVLLGILALTGMLFISVTNGFSSGSYGSNINTTCAPDVVYTGDCALCHSGSYSNSTPAKDAYLAGGAILTDFFCPAPDIGYSMPNKPSMKTEAIADFDGDGSPDVLVRDTDNGRWYMMLMDADLVLMRTRVELRTHLVRELAGVGDFNGDGKADILLRNTENGRWIMSLMDGATVLSDTLVHDLRTNFIYELAGISDFDGDGNDDILLRNTENGRWLINLMDSDTVLSTNVIN